MNSIVCIRCFNLNLLECKFYISFIVVIIVRVLISTYWNVNISSTKLIAIADCFNLNLLECKWLALLLVMQFFKGFNLNLLECK